MTDLHTHILPGLDDGAETMEEALEMAELAAEGGTGLLVATPHSNQKNQFENYHTDELKQIYREFCDALKQQKIPVKVNLGMEIFASEDMAEKIEEGVLIGLNQTSVYLIEFPFHADPNWIGERLEEVLDIGRIPLIAHPERYYCVQDQPLFVYEWLRLGCMTQINKGSLLGRFGRRVFRSADMLLEYDLVSCVASDAHSAYRRTTYMEDVREYLEERCGPERASRLLLENPGRILAGRDIPPHGRFPGRKRKLFW